MLQSFNKDNTTVSLTTIYIDRLQYIGKWHKNNLLSDMNWDPAIPISNNIWQLVLLLTFSFQLGNASLEELLNVVKRIRDSLIYDYL